MSCVTYLVRFEMDESVSPTMAAEAVRRAVDDMTSAHPVVNRTWAPSTDVRTHINVRTIKQDRVQSQREELVRKQAEAWEALIVFMADRRINWHNWPGKTGADKMLNCLGSHLSASMAACAAGDPVQDVKDAVAAAAPKIRTAILVDDNGTLTLHSCVQAAIDLAVKKALGERDFRHNSLKFLVDVHQAQLAGLDAGIASINQRIDNAPRF